MISFKQVTSLVEAHEIWQILSPGISVFDSWDFRHAGFAATSSELVFLVGYEDETMVGVLPLQKKPDGSWEFFGGAIMEDNGVFVKTGYESHIPEFYNLIKNEPHELSYIRGTDSYTQTLTNIEPKFILDLTKYSNFEDYIRQAFSKNSRGKLKNKVAEIDELGVKIVENRFEDIEKLIEMNIVTFSNRGEVSSFLIPGRKDFYTRLTTLANCKIHVLSYVFQDKVVGVCLSLSFGQTYLCLNAGTNMETVPNLGTYVYYTNIRYAFNLGVNIFDSCAGSFNWKERFHLDAIPQYRFS